MRIRMVYWPGLLLLASCGLFAQKLGNAIYHWQDDQGVSHYSRQPPLDRAAVQINTATINLSRLFSDYPMEPQI